MFLRWLLVFGNKKRSVTLEGRNSVVIGPGSEILAGAEFTTRIDPTLVPVDQTDYSGDISLRAECFVKVGSVSLSVPRLTTPPA